MTCQCWLALTLLSWTAAPDATSGPASQPTVNAIVAPSSTTAPAAFKFSPEDDALLDEVEHAAFLYFWNEIGQPAQLARDRKLAPVASIAAVGFQLTSLPIGVERKWITREQGGDRAATVLRALLARDDNRKLGVFIHYPDMNTAGGSHEGFELLASTVDHALFLAGALTAGEYFGDEVAELAGRIAAETNWRAFVRPDGFVSMGWEPETAAGMKGAGHLHALHWWIASDEERLIGFLGAGAPNAEFALGPEFYYGLQRPVRRLGDGPPFVASWPGALFTYFFSHCWIDYGRLGPDDPGRFGRPGPSVDWIENSRRAVLAHRARCIEFAPRFHTLAADRWGLSACASRDGYIVPQVRPNISGEEEWFEGTVAPYAAASAIMFTPAESLAAIRAFRTLKAADGSLLAWRDPQQGGYGFVDSFNIDQNHACEDYVGIDHGPMLVAIENARTGLVWKLFMRTDVARRAVETLKLGR